MSSQVAGKQQQGAQQHHGPQLTPEQQEKVIAHLKSLMAEKNMLGQKIVELSADVREHALVLEVLKPMEKDRKAWRKVGGALMERDVGHCEQAVREAHDGLSQLVTDLEKQYAAKEEEVEDFQRRFQLSVNGMPPPPPRAVEREKSDEQS